MPDYPWCKGCPVCSEESDLHLYVDDCNSSIHGETLVLGMFGTNHPRFWGGKNIEARTGLGLKSNRPFRFAEIRGPNSPEAGLGRAILAKLIDAPLQFFARGFSAPFTERDTSFSNPAERLRFYLAQFGIMATARVRVPTALVLSRGPQGDDPEFMKKLQVDVDEASRKRGLPKVTVGEQHMKDCLLLQVSDLIAGCTRQLNSPGRNPTKLGLALDLNTHLLRSHHRYVRRTWDWSKYRGGSEKT